MRASLRPVHKGGRAGGFSLIEVMIALALAATLAMAAIPMHRALSKRVYRGDAALALLRARLHVEMQCRPDHGFGSPAGGMAMPLPANLARAPAHGRRAYSIHVLRDARGGVIYEARPDPYGPMAADECGSLLINEQGERMNHLVQDEGRAARCWPLS